MKIFKFSITNLIFTLVVAVLVTSTVVFVNLKAGKTFKNGNSYNSYALQAQSWLNGRLDLARDYGHLELAYYDKATKSYGLVENPVDGVKDNLGDNKKYDITGKIYVSFPPFPSVILLPFVALFGLSAYEHVMALLMIVLAAVYAYKLCRSFSMTNLSSAFLSIFATLGSNLLFLSVDGGGVWFFAQTAAFLFTIMSFYYAKCEMNSMIPNFLAPFFLACAVGCRPFQAIYAPVVAYLLYKRYAEKFYEKPFLNFCKRLSIWVIPAALLCGFYMLINYLRFDSPFEFGHNYLPEFTRNPDTPQFGMQFLNKNIKNLFRLPYFNDGAWDFQRHDGFAFWLTNMLFVPFAAMTLLCFFRPFKKYAEGDIVLQIAIPLLIITHLILTCLHKTMGGWHFGNRYTIDALPAALLGLLNLLGTRKKGMIIANTPLVLFGIFINIYGTIWIHTS